MRCSHRLTDAAVLGHPRPWTWLGSIAANEHNGRHLRSGVCGPHRAAALPVASKVIPAFCQRRCAVRGRSANRAWEDLRNGTLAPGSGAQGDAPTPAGLCR